MARTSYKKDGNKWYKIYKGSVLEIDLSNFPDTFTITFHKSRETNFTRKQNIKREKFERMWLDILSDLQLYVKKSIHPTK
jgi:hypothetical protein